MRPGVYTHTPIVEPLHGSESKQLGAALIAPALFSFSDSTSGQNGHQYKGQHARETETVFMSAANSVVYDCKIFSKVSLAVIWQKDVLEGRWLLRMSYIGIQESWLLRTHHAGRGPKRHGLDVQDPRADITVRKCP